MKKLLPLTLMLAAVAILAMKGEGSSASATGPPVEIRPEYLALGDSLAVGIGASDPTSTGYVPLFHSYLGDAVDPGRAKPAPLSSVPDAFNRKFLRLANLGVGGEGAPPGGETTDSMIAGGQLDAALAELSARNGNARPVDDVRVVTLDIGGNDMFAVVPDCMGGPTEECTDAIGTALATISANFDFILSELRAAAGPDTTVIVMTYYNPLVNAGCQLSPHASLGDALLEGDPALGLPGGLNDLIRTIAASHGAGVADVFGLLESADVNPDCRHANDAGYEIIADEFMAAFEKASAEPKFTLVYYDGHMHTTRSDGSGSVADIKATAQARDLDAVIVTDHCKSLTQDKWKSLVKETRDASDKDFLALPGFEVTGSDGIFNRDHFLAYNVSDPFVGDNALELCPEEVWESPLNPEGTGPVYPENLTAWADYIHSRGGIAVHNHTSGSTQLSYGVNTIEIYNQSHVDDIASYAIGLGIPPQDAWGFAMTINNFAIYGERDLMMLVDFPGAPTPIPLRLALYLATQALPPHIGQIMGWSDPPDPNLPGDLNSWDELLMAYVDGTVDTPTFAVANSDAHNTGDPDSSVGLAKNGLYVERLTRDDFYKAIKAGRSFATTGPSLALDVNGEFMGDTAAISDGTAELNLSVDSESPTAILVKIDVIKNGDVLQSISPMWPTYESSFTDGVGEDGYYRVEVVSYDLASDAYDFAWSNPVFVDVP